MKRGSGRTEDKTWTELTTLEKIDKVYRLKPRALTEIVLNIAIFAIMAGLFYKVLTVTLIASGDCSQKSFWIW